MGPGCRTALRATYADSTGTFVVTVGIAVLDSRPPTQALAPATDPGAGLTDGSGLTDESADGLTDGSADGFTAGFAAGTAPDPEAVFVAGPTAGLGTVSVAAPTAGLGAVFADAGRPATVRPVAFPGGAAEGFGDRQYFTGVVVDSDERYVVATAAGYADGRAYRPGDGALVRLRHAARQLATVLHQALTR
ncbi:hypothetical protein GCM10009733_073200 [Nonomuraea maheshkhaliensis]|uniref:Uncharacterized protein n=1 Tax=Nonomuraea maheshkhaliensis TaxID=419590 RepID=A0ABN2G3R9_9ACTN